MFHFPVDSAACFLLNGSVNRAQFNSSNLVVVLLQHLWILSLKQISPLFFIQGRLFLLFLFFTRPTHFTSCCGLTLYSERTGFPLAFGENTSPRCNPHFLVLCL